MCSLGLLPLEETCVWFILDQVCFVAQEIRTQGLLPGRNLGVRLTGLWAPFQHATVQYQKREYNQSQVYYILQLGFKVWHGCDWMKSRSPDLRSQLWHVLSTPWIQWQLPSAGRETFVHCTKVVPVQMHFCTQQHCLLTNLEWGSSISRSLHCLNLVLYAATEPIQTLLWIQAIQNKPNINASLPEVSVGVSSTNNTNNTVVTSKATITWSCTDLCLFHAQHIGVLPVLQFSALHKFTCTASYDIDVVLCRPQIHIAVLRIAEVYLHGVIWHWCSSLPSTNSYSY